jgi:hypothetical protein
MLILGVGRLTQDPWSGKRTCPSFFGTELSLICYRPHDEQGTTMSEAEKVSLPDVADLRDSQTGMQLRRGMSHEPCPQTYRQAGRCIQSELGRQ